MIAQVRGTLLSVGEQSVVIELPGGAVALEVFVPRVAIESLQSKLNEPIELLTITTIESLAQGATLIPRLLGFQSREQRELFEHLTKVKGLGPRRVLRAMAEEVSAIASAIVNEDAKALSKLPEIGKKLADSIVLELKGKVGALALAGSLDAAAGGGRGAGLAGKPGASAIGRSEHANRAIAALVKLGESPSGAEQLVDAVTRDHPDLTTADEVLAAAFARRG